ncbi:MAG: AlpA family phage regulatory protein [Hydrogenophaga sp.]|uniref:helix-turn-helix transcriptional regulator n=1 Tax=Hydrogenophaga sp. TaxID=1904254 RepID=UPI0027322D31|nr:AlpA family phage regulatory protein [Hydrogenophaga sp.]MDP3627123.1 AlpA family phage regulatory protein [Hydrogenophaga sp.]
MINLKPAAVDLEHAAAFVSLSESAVLRLVREGNFPKPRQLSGRRVGYLVRELEEWVESRPISEILPPDNAGYGRAGRPVEAANASM